MFVESSLGRRRSFETWPPYLCVEIKPALKLYGGYTILKMPTGRIASSRGGRELCPTQLYYLVCLLGSGWGMHTLSIVLYMYVLYSTYHSTVYDSDCKGTAMRCLGLLGDGVIPVRPWIRMQQKALGKRVEDGKALGRQGRFGSICSSGINQPLRP